MNVRWGSRVVDLGEIGPETSLSDVGDPVTENRQSEEVNMRNRRCRTKEVLE